MKESFLNWDSKGWFMMLVTVLVVTQSWAELAMAFLNRNRAHYPKLAPGWQTAGADIHFEPSRFFLLEEVHFGDS